MTDVLIKREKLDAETDTHMKECHVKVEILLPQAKELPEARKKSWNRSAP